MPQLELKNLDRLSCLLLAGHSCHGLHYQVATDLSAYMEWYWLRHTGHALGSLTTSGPLKRFHHGIQSKAPSWTTSDALLCGFIKVRRKHSDIDDLRWVRFRYELQRAAIAAGFDRQWGRQIAGAVGELEDNVHRHSEAADTAILAYLVTASKLEFVVLDRGIGVLQSLRRSAEHSWLIDHGTALRLATQNGTSRYGNESGCGWGFNDLFVGLANKRADVRFRSGDHLLQIEGRTGLPASQLRQRASGQGLLVSVRVSAVGS